MTSKDDSSCTPPSEKVISKDSFRFRVWNELENKDLVRFPRPCKGRIPNFVDCMVAAEKLSSLDAFKKAEVIMVNIDKPQEPVRFITLEAGKTLLVPIARLGDGLVTKVCPPADANKQLMRAACRRRGVDSFGKAVDLNDKIHIDMIVLGSVAVSKQGHRIGKGGGYSDLEFAVLVATGAVTKDTVIVTTVHDEQVFATLPDELFKPFDVPVDVIVTPTQVVEVTPRLPRPQGLFWHMLSQRRMQQIPFIKTLRDKEISNGKDCTLKEVDSEPEERPRPYYRPSYQRRRMPYQRRQAPARSDHSDDSRPPSPRARSNRRTRTFRRRPQVDGSGDANVSKSTADQRGQKGGRRERKVDGENKENQQDRPVRRGQRRFFRNKLPVDFSVKVGNIGSTVRVRDLKAALIEKGVRPRDITWKGSRGFALLHFAKAKVEPEQPTAVDDVIASLQGLTVKCKTEQDVKETLLSIEPAKPISRIENAGVTTV